jgi:hypothetical protein
MWGRWLAIANSVIRLGYGLAALAAPSKPAFGSVPLAPDTDRFPEARLFVRGFAAHQIAVALVGLAGVARRDPRRGMLLAAATDFTDIAAALAEGAARGRLDSDLSGGIVFSGAGLVSALAALSDT